MSTHPPVTASVPAAGSAHAGAPATRSWFSGDFVLVGGVPGAGKSTAIAAAMPDLVGVRALDPDSLRYWFAHRFPSTPYRFYRPLCHALHAVVVLSLVLLGPRRAGRLLVHEPSTRPARLRALSWLARRRGWSPALVYVDAPPETALAGQVSRGRVIDPSSFAGHVRRWELLRQQAASGRCCGWSTVLTDRTGAADALRIVLRDSGHLRASGDADVPGQLSSAVPEAGSHEPQAA